MVTVGRIRGEALRVVLDHDVAVEFAPCVLVNRKLTVRLAALMGFLGVALGAFGAHALKDTLIANEHLATWKTAVLYQLVHALALLVLSRFPVVSKVTAWSFVIGIVLFSGSLYLLSLTDISKLGMITPLGGLAFLVGWAVLGIAPTQDSEEKG